MAFSEVLRELRLSEGYSQERLAREINVTRDCISNWERKICEPDIRTLVILSELLNVTLDELVDRKSYCYDNSNPDKKVRFANLILNDDEQNIIKGFRELDANKKRTVRDFISSSVAMK